MKSSIIESLSIDVSIRDIIIDIMDYNDTATLIKKIEDAFKSGVFDKDTADIMRYALSHNSKIKSTDFSPVYQDAIDILVNNKYSCGNDLSLPLRSRGFYGHYFCRFMKDDEIEAISIISRISRPTGTLMDIASNKEALDMGALRNEASRILTQSSDTLKGVFTTLKQNSLIDEDRYDFLVRNVERLGTFSTINHPHRENRNIDIGI